MDVHYKSIRTVCPRCGKEKEISVPEKLFKEKNKGYVKIQVPKGAVCHDHVFVVFLNLHGKIVGYENIDLSISSSDIKNSREEDSIDTSKIVSLEKYIEMIGFQCLVGLLHAKLFNYISCIILEKEFEVNVDAINNFLDDIVPEMYRNPGFLNEIVCNEDMGYATEYFYVRIRTEPVFIINSRKHVVQIPWKTGLELEDSIINSALSKDDQEEQIKFLSYYISKFLEDVDKTINILKKIKKISRKDLVKKLKEIAITSTVTKNYISTIKEFIHQRIAPEIAKKIQE